MIASVKRTILHSDAPLILKLIGWYYLINGFLVVLAGFVFVILGDKIVQPLAGVLPQDITQVMLYLVSFFVLVIGGLIGVFVGYGLLGKNNRAVMWAIVFSAFGVLSGMPRTNGTFDYIGWIMWVANLVILIYLVKYKFSSRKEVTPEDILKINHKS